MGGYGNRDMETMESRYYVVVVLFAHVVYFIAAFSDVLPSLHTCRDVTAQ